MSIDFRRKNISFTDRTGAAVIKTVSVTFDSQVIKADVAISGFQLYFTGTDRPIYHEKVYATVSAVSGNTVTVTVEAGLRDHSGTYDDPFSGKVDILVIADV